METEELLKLPEELSPVNMRAYLTNAFGICGCFETEETIETIDAFLAWLATPLESRLGYEKLFHGDLGVYYLMIARFDQLGLCEHGTSARFPWLTSEGERLHIMMRADANSENGDWSHISEATGTAYDGCWYGEF